MHQLSSKLPKHFKILNSNVSLHHRCYPIFNNSSVKISYFIAPNLVSIISFSNNNTTLRKLLPPPTHAYSRLKPSSHNLIKVSTRTTCQQVLSEIPRSYPTLTQLYFRFSSTNNVSTMLAVNSNHGAARETCNYQVYQRCPLGSFCLHNNVVYKCRVIPPGSQQTRVYIGGTVDSSNTATMHI